MTTKLEQAARLALEALKEIEDLIACYIYSSGLCYAATAALREALAEQSEQIPVGYIYNDITSDRMPVYAAPQPVKQEPCKECGAKQAQIDRLMLEYCPSEMTSEQIQEWGNSQQPVNPVAWMRLNEKGECENIKYIGNFDEHLYLPPSCQWLYAAPVRTKNLTEEDINELWNTALMIADPTAGNLRFKFARAVIAADREKNK